MEDLRSVLEDIEAGEDISGKTWDTIMDYFEEIRNCLADAEG